MQHRQERGRRHALAPESADAAQAYLALLASTTPLTAVQAPAAALGAPAGSPVIAPPPPAAGAPTAPGHPAAPGSVVPAPAPTQPAAPGSATAAPAPAAPGSATAAASTVPGSDDDAARAYLALLGSRRPLGPAAPVPAPEPAVTARRFQSHRAPARATVPFALLGQRGRSAVMTAALIAGVSVAGLSTATANAHSAAQASSRTAVHTPLEPSTGTGALPTDAAATGTGTFPAGATATGTDDLPIDATGAGSDAGTAAAVATDATAAGRDAGTTALAAAQAEQDANQVSTGGALAGAPLQRKTRPQPKVSAAAWVNPLPEGAVTSCFGQRWGRLHAGVDLATASGTPIRAAGAGTVVAAGPADGYGNAVLIDHGNGYLTHYGHMSEITTAVGRKVKAGQQIGLEGSTGHSTGPHLHFEVHQGHYKNPIEPTGWMHEHGVDIPGCTDLTEDHED